ncbi:thioredoxin fold domain-containing protein [Photobacterium leiognathi]|uniref:thioredoxin fold domain-containing protein n=1 Tax=Photobacterium leiognathi TaxID=553611 RepID=UPI002980E1EC|nr:thioredoxin fold domain-containing protein [Photobacterium leiognathi]
MNTKLLTASISMALALALNIANATPIAKDNSNAQNVNMQTTNLTAFDEVLNRYGDLAVKLGNNDTNKEIIFFYDNSCKFCQHELAGLPEITKSGINVYVLPFLNHGFYTDNARKMFAAWSTDQPLSTLLTDKDIDKVELKRQVAEEMADLTMFARNTLNIKKTPFMLFSNGEFIDGYASPHDLVAYLKSH